MTRRALSWPVALWAATGLQKVATFGFVVALGRLAGTPGLGAYASLLTLCGLTAALAHLGLPDWVLYQAAQSRATSQPLDGRAPEGHALFLGSAALACALCTSALPWVVEVPALRPFGGLVLVGLFVAHVPAYALGTLRGSGDARPEALAQAASAATLGAAALLASSLEQLGVGFACAGAWLLGPWLWAVRRRGLAPRLPGLPAARALAGSSVKYMTLSLLSMGLWSSPTALTRLWSSSAEVGLLQAAVVLLFGGLFGATVFGTLLVRRVQAGAASARLLAAVLGPALAVPAAVASWLGYPLLAAHFGVDPQAMRPVLLLATAVAPLSYAGLLWLPIAVGLDPPRARLALMAALAVTMGAGVWLKGRGAPGALLAFAAGLVVFLALAGGVVLRRRAGVEGRDGAAEV